MKIPLYEYGRLLRQYLVPHMSSVVTLTVLLLCATALQLVVPQVMRHVIDSAMQVGLTSALVWTVVLFFVLALLEQGTTTLATYFGEDVAWRTTNHLRADLTRHCLKLDLSFHNAHTPGSLIERVDGDVSALANFFSTFVVQILGSALFLVGLVGVLFALDWRAGLTVLAYLLVSFTVINSFRHLAIPHWAASWQANADLYGFLEERITGAAAVRSSGATDFVLNRFYDLTRKAWRVTVKAALMASAFVNVSWIAFALGNAASLVLAAYLYKDGTLTLGAAYLLVHYVFLLDRPIEAINQQLEDVQRASASITRIQELLQMQTKVPDGPGVKLPEGALAVEFRHVTFGYVGERPVIQNLSFQLKPGTVLGLLGRTGSGKTTVTRLITRLYHPESGAVRLGAGPAEMADLRQARQTELATHVAMVTQRVQLFDASLRDNLTFFDPTVPDERIMQALEELGLGPWFSSLPEGLNTSLGAGGGGLSAGEAQLLAFTRVFLRNPGLIILDEPTSRLDPATEQVVQRAVERLLKGRTAIIIAHRLTTVDKVDEIMILEQGRIKEHGTRAALAGDSCSHFVHLLQTGIEEVIA